MAEQKDTAAAAPKAAPRTEATLKKAHTHAGKACKPGDKIAVTDKQKARLTERGII